MMTTSKDGERVKEGAPVDKKRERRISPFPRKKR